MPNLDRTGPQGQGPMTGRRMGRCSNNKTTKTSDTTEKSTGENEILYGVGRGGRPWGGGMGRCFGGGRWRGWGRRRGFGENQTF